MTAEHPHERVELRRILTLACDGASDAKDALNDFQIEPSAENLAKVQHAATKPTEHEEH